MLKPEIQEFARLLITEVRDRSIACCDMNLRPEVNSPVAKRWRDKLSTGLCKDVATEMIADCVDETLGTFLRAIDQGILRISFVASNGNVVDLTEDGMGELTGWYMGGGGWVPEYSQQRYVDDFQDLDGFFGRERGNGNGNEVRP